MTKYIQLLCVTLCCIQTQAQPINISLYGEVLNNNKSIDTLYYSFNTSTFNANQYLLLNGNNYTFNITTSTIKNLKISKLNFSNSASANPNLSSDCHTSINIEALLKLPPPQTQIWRINTNINFYQRCTTLKTDQTINETNGSHNFIGRYRMVSKANPNIVYEVKLEALNKDYTSSFSPMNTHYMTGEEGHWTYDTEQATLTFSIYKETNSKVGLEKMVVRRFYTFKVIRKKRRILFESDQFDLLKIE